jgi:restriction endonuclease S subunit
MSETLESIARALFQSWFVDFDPVRAKSEGRGTGLPKHIADLFPDSFEESELGTIPKGWRMSPLGEQVTLQRGTTYKGSLKGLPGPVLLGLASIERNGGFRSDKLSTYGGESPSNVLLGQGEIYVSLKDVTQSADLLGAVARVPLGIRGRLTQDTVSLTFKSNALSRNIVYRTLLRDEYREYCRSHATGTTNLGLSREDFLAYPVVAPPSYVQDVFESAVARLDERGVAASTESRVLAGLRDKLLPKLISGELRVREVAEI